MIVVLFSFIITSLIIPQFYARRPSFETGTIARQNIRADRDFLVEDRAATKKKVDEATINAPPVFDYDDSLPQQIKDNLKETFLTISSLPVQRKDKARLEKGLKISITDEEFAVLKKYNFDSSVVEKMSRLVDHFYRTGYITDAPIPKLATKKGIIIRDIRYNREEEKKDFSGIITLKNLDARLKNTAKKLMVEEEDLNLQKVINSLVQKSIRPNLTYNKELTETKREELIKAVKPVYVEILKNEILIREGEKITEEAAHKLEAYFSIKSEGWMITAGRFLGVFMLLMLLTGFLFQGVKLWFREEIRKADAFLLIVTAVLQIILIKVGIFISHALHQAFPFIPLAAAFFAIPFGVGVILIAVLINQGIALIFSILSAFFLGFFFEFKFVMSLFFIVGSIAVITQSKHCHKRSAFFRSGLLLGVVNAFSVLAIRFLSEDTVIFDTPVNTLMGIAGGMIGGLLAGFIVAGITPIFESLFDYTTDIKLLELANLNHPLFQKMIREAPGTYHHSIITASLVEAAAESIGCNALLAKVGAYYHDIGKMKKPQYFIENQGRSENRHDHISPKMSSLVIISHVKDGCELAKEMKLGREITNIIREHHGTSLVSYFWEKAKKDGSLSLSTTSEDDFRYPGPKPQTPEAGLVLLGDVIEASSRTLTNPTPARISHLVRERIEQALSDGQLDDCKLTLKDLNLIAESFTRILNGIFHHRIDYPDAKDIVGKRNINGHFNRKFSESHKSRYTADQTFSEQTNGRTRLTRQGT